ncbi:MAG: hypothetical protein ACI914_000781 [Candidatus Marivariicella framensis]|jgi:hypothetical protein|tara:strand:+ start:536 stop:637 length:102 start_codon:yes stop_codon:yes gene_type:complete
MNIKTLISSETGYSPTVKGGGGDTWEEKSDFFK